MAECIILLSKLWVAFLIKSLVRVLNLLINEVDAVEKQPKQSWINESIIAIHVYKKTTMPLEPHELLVTSKGTRVFSMEVT